MHFRKIGLLSLNLTDLFTEFCKMAQIEHVGAFDSPEVSP